MKFSCRLAHVFADVGHDAGASSFLEAHEERNFADVVFADFKLEDPTIELDRTIAVVVIHDAGADEQGKHVIGELDDFDFMLFSQLVYSFAYLSAESVEFLSGDSHGASAVIAQSEYYVFTIMSLEIEENTAIDADFFTGFHNTHRYPLFALVLILENYVFI